MLRKERTLHCENEGTTANAQGWPHWLFSLAVEKPQSIPLWSRWRDHGDEMAAKLTSQEPQTVMVFYIFIEMIT